MAAAAIGRLKPFSVTMGTKCAISAISPKAKSSDAISNHAKVGERTDSSKGCSDAFAWATDAALSTSRGDRSNIVSASGKIINAETSGKKLYPARQPWVSIRRSIITGDTVELSPVPANATASAKPRETEKRATIDDVQTAGVTRGIASATSDQLAYHCQMLALVNISVAMVSVYKTRPGITTRRAPNRSTSKPLNTMPTALITLSRNGPVVISALLQPKA